MAMNEEFFTKVFMNPAYNFTSFFYGMLMSLVYMRFRKERGYQSELRNSFSSRLMEMIRHNPPIRYLIYLVGLSLMISTILWQTQFVGEPHKHSTMTNSMYGTFAFPLFLVGLSMLLMPALASRAAAFRFFFGTQSWTMLGQCITGIYYTAPCIAIFYFMSSQHQIHVTYYMFVYYFVGNFVFSLMLYIPVCMIIDRPIYALMSLKEDKLDARNHQYYQLKDYLENFKELPNESVPSNMRISSNPSQLDHFGYEAEERDRVPLIKAKYEDRGSTMAERDTTASHGELLRGTKASEKARFTREFNLEQITEEKH